MFNTGFRGKRASDGTGIINPQDNFVQNKYPVPTITNWTISGSDDDALNPAGGQTILVNGGGFVAGCAASVNGVTITPVTVISANQISFTSPALAGGSYTLIVYNSTGGGAILVPGLVYSSVPTYTTAQGSIGSGYETSALSTSVVATSDSSITYTITSGALPSGASMTSGGVITGTYPTLAAGTSETFYFDITATDAEDQDVTRSFTLTTNIDVVSWVTPSSGATITLDGTSYSQALSATDAAGYSVSYSANALPTGLTLSSGTISGTPSAEGTTSTLLTATAATTNRTGTNTITWVVSLSDAFWKNVSLLLSGSTPTTTFINDASLNNSQLTIAGDTKSNNFSPYQGNGYYSVSHSATPDYLSIPHNSNFSVTSGMSDTLIVEGWFYFNVVSPQTSLFDKSGVNTVSFANWTVYLNASSQIQLQWGVSGTPGTSNIGTVPSTFVPVTGTWYHIAFVKTSADWAVFANGTRIITYNGLNTAGDANPSALRIGYGIQSGANGVYFNGYISNVRAWRGTSGAPYSATSATLTVPTSPLTAIAGTTLLSHQSARFIDVSSAAATITATGANIKVSSALPFAGSSSYSTYGSGYFDGTGDYLTRSNINFASNPFTIEGWFYPTTLDVGRNFWGMDNGASSNPKILMYVDSSSRLTVDFGNAGTTQFPVAASLSTYGLVVNQWHHIAVVRSDLTSTGFKLYINGINAGTGQVGTNLNTITANFNIGYIGEAYGNPFVGYINDFRITNGTALYTANFLPSQQPLTPVANTSLLTCQYNGGANNNGFVDQSSFNNIITRNGNTTQGTFSPYSQNGWSNYFNGSTDYLYTTAAALSTNSFTIECWFNANSFSASPAIIDYRTTTTNGAYPLIYLDTTGAPIYYVSSASRITGSALSLNTWYHIAVSRSGTSTKMFVNGTQVGSTWTDTTNYLTADTRPIVGTSGYSSSGFFTGYISNLRVVNGTALYTSNFTPSTTPLTAVPKTVWLIAQSNRNVDNSYINSVLIGGTPSIQAYSPFGGVTIVPTSYSNYFDGTGDYLSVTGTSLDASTTTDYTVEFWMYAVKPGPGTTQMIYELGTGTTDDLQIYINASGLTFQVDGNASTAITFLDNTWVHVACVKTGTTLTTYINGQGTVVDTGVTVSSKTTAYIGIRAGTSLPLAGHISNLRVTRAAVYTGNFTPSTTPLTAIANTVLLTCQSNTMVDNSTNSLTLTAAGDVKPRPFNPFGLTNTTAVSYTPSVNGGSMYFDGTGDYLQTATGLIHTDITQTDYTIECWVYNMGAGAERYIYSQRGASSGWEMRINAANTVSTFFTSGTTFTTTATVPANAWTHIAATRVGTTIRVFINGVQSATGTQSNGTSAYASYGLWLGNSTSAGGGLMLGYISDARVIKGQSLYNANFYPGSAPAISTNNTTYLLNGTSGGIIDYHGSNDLETVGNTQLASEDPYSGSYYSNYFDGTGDYLTLSHNTALSMGSSDFTVEFWIYSTSFATENKYVWFKRPSTASGTGLGIGFEATTGKVKLLAGDSEVSAWEVNIVSTNAVSLNTWTHIAVTRNSSTWTVYINGDSNGTATASITVDDSSGTAYVGSASTTSGLIVGYVSNLRIVKGTALYTSTFTPSTTPLTAVAGTSLLTCQSNTFKDNSTNNFTITSNGDTNVKSRNPFQQNTGKSLYFDGTGDYLKSYNVEPIRFGAGNFTIEFWMYPTVLNAAMVILSSAQTGVQGGNVDIRTDYIGATSTPIYFAGGAADYWATYNGPLIGLWTHIAFVRNGSTVTTYVNGVSIGTGAAGTQTSTAFQAINIGGGSVLPVSGYQGFQGYIKDLRITKGVARTITVPTAPYKTN